MRTFLIFIFVALVSLFVYNPELDDFTSFLDKNIQQANNQREQTSITDRMFNADTTTADQKPVGYSTKRNNYLLFSTYTLTISDDFREEELGKYLGVATMFFEIAKSENMTAHAAQP
ncbi:MAG: hypothetical protein AB8G77_15250 [Rhodothermales bacterium]